MREDDEPTRQDRRRIGHVDDGRTGRQAGYDRDGYGYGPQGSYLPPDGYQQREYARESGIRASRRASTWTAAALIAAVAATTGYLAHSAAATTGTTTTGQGTATPGKSTYAGRGAPAVGGPVVTSGGSGVTAGGGGGGGGDD